MHELSTNAVKYGALPNGRGLVTINWHIVADVLELVWTESGGPRVQLSARTEFGSRMIERALSKSIQGTAEIDCRHGGTVFTIRTQADNLVEALRGGPEL